MLLYEEEDGEVNIALEKSCQNKNQASLAPNS